MDEPVGLAQDHPIHDSDYYGPALLLLRRWSLNERGLPVCAQNALDTSVASGAEVSAALAGNAAVRSALGIEEAAPPVRAVPARVTNFQARAMLMQTPSGAPGLSLFDVIDGTLRAGKDASQEGALAWQAWEQANDFYRDGTLVNQLAGQFGLTMQEIDILFINAEGISA